MDSLYETIHSFSGDYEVRNYGRYWHGYQIILCPLLCFLTYAEIRQINMFLQIAAVFVFVFLAVTSRKRMLCLPFFVMYIFLSPVSLFSSLQYSPCFYIMMLALLVLFAFDKYMNDVRRNYLFLLVGILTAFFDLLTYPLVTLGVPLIAFLGTDYECMSSLKKSLKSMFDHSISWVIGYMGMWMSKWIIASVLTEENIILDAVQRIDRRTGHHDAAYTWSATVKRNISICNLRVLLPVLIGIGVYILVSMLKNLRCTRRFLPGTWVILAVSLYPFIWYYIVLEHSWVHSFFTWRELAISVWGMLMIGIANMGPVRDIADKS